MRSGCQVPTFKVTNLRSVLYPNLNDVPYFSEKESQKNVSVTIEKAPSSKDPNFHSSNQTLTVQKWHFCSSVIL